MRHTPAIVTAVAAGALALLCATPASAAPGFVRVYGPDGQVLTYADPKAGLCYAGSGPNSALVNRTEGTVLLFPDRGCRTKIFHPVGPGETAHGSIGGFMPLD